MMLPDNNEIRFEVTTLCNYSCPMCPVHSMSRNKEFMSYNLFVYLLDKISKNTNQYNMITFSGMGEPFLDSNLSSKVKYSIDKEFKVLILTNGSKLTVDKFKELEDLGVTSIRVSMHGNTPESYSAAFGGASLKQFDLMKNDLTLICKIKRKTQLILTYVINPGMNDDDINDFIEYWQDKADKLEIWKQHNWADGRSYRDIQTSNISCGRPFSGPLQIQVDGTINMCCFDYDGKLLLGDLKSQSLDEIFNSEAFKKILIAHKDGKYENLICEKCDQRNIDKSDIMIYPKHNVTDRVNQFSTSYNLIR